MGRRAQKLSAVARLGLQGRKMPPSIVIKGPSYYFPLWTRPCRDGDMWWVWVGSLFACDDAFLFPLLIVFYHHCHPARLRQKQKLVRCGY